MTALTRIPGPTSQERARPDPCETCGGAGFVHSERGGIDACPDCARQAEAEWRVLHVVAGEELP